MRQVVIMGRDLSQAQDHDLSPLVSSGHLIVQPPSKPWRDFLKYIEASRRAVQCYCRLHMLTSTSAGALIMHACTHGLLLVFPSTSEGRPMMHECMRALQQQARGSSRGLMCRSVAGHCADIDARLLLCFCRVLFAPNVHDASPRVLAEAMCLDVPILVNRHILGGWKYVNNNTGAFFGSEDDVVDAFKGILAAQEQGQLRPREWYKCASALASRQQALHWFRQETLAGACSASLCSKPAAAIQPAHVQGDDTLGVAACHAGPTQARSGRRSGCKHSSSLQLARSA
jgi:hypothetical protein